MVRDARDAQLRGDLRRPADLARSVVSDGAVSRALQNRTAPVRGLPRSITASDQRLLEQARRQFLGNGPGSLRIGTLVAMMRRYVLHSVSVGQITWDRPANGGQWSPTVHAWPSNALWWNPYEQRLEAITDQGPVEVVHGDGRWIVVSSTDVDSEDPWTSAALAPLGLLWADRQVGIMDRSEFAERQAGSKWLAGLPEKVETNDDNAVAYLDKVEEMASRGQSGILIPHGYTLEQAESNARIFEIFRDLIDGDGRDIDGVLLGAGGVTENAGGNYIKSWMLWGVRNDLIEGDLAALSWAISTGLLRPWSLVNFGKDVDDLTLSWLMPDPDEDARQKSIADRVTLFNKGLASYAANGFDVNAAFVAQLSTMYGVPVPKLLEDRVPKPHLVPLTVTTEQETDPGNTPPTDDEAA